MNYTLIFFLALVVYVSSVDKNVVDYFILQLKLLKVNIERLKFLIIYHPDNFITTWVMNRKLKKFIDEMSSKN